MSKSANDSEERAATPRRSRSWVDALLALIARIPGPAWVFFGGVTLFFVVGSAGVRWLDGSQQLGAVDPPVTAYALLTVYGLAAVYYLNETARRSLAAFRPALGTLESEYGELERSLTTMSQPAAVTAIVAGAVVQAVGALTSPVGWGISAHTSILTNVFTVLQQDIFGIFLLIFLFRSIGQLRMIGRIHREATRVNLYDRGPHTAFSRFTLAAAVSVAVPYGLVQAFAAIFAPFSIVEVVLLSLILVASIALFVLPLNGMHRRLVREKVRLASESDQRFESVATRLHEHLRTGDLGDVDSLTTAMSGLMIESDRLKKISTWPWRADTFRGLLSSIALPILLWLITTLLSRVVAGAG